MKNIRLLSLLLALIMLLLCACAPNVTDTSDDVSPDVSSDDLSDTPSDESDITQPTLADFWADETSVTNNKVALGKYLEEIDTELYSSSKRLAVLSNPAKSGYTEALKLFEYFKDKTKDYNWYKINPLVPDVGQSTAEEMYNDCGDIICIDTDYFVPDGKEDNAATELIMCSERRLTFHWALPYLAPRFSELCGTEVDGAPTEEQIKTAAITFLKTYFPEYHDDEYIITVEFKGNYAEVYFSEDMFKIDPDSDVQRKRFIASVRFSWDETDLLYTNYGHDKKEKAMICDFVIGNPYGEHLQCEGYKDIITQEEAFENYVSGQAGNDIGYLKGTGYKSYIAYKVTAENKREPYWFFVFLNQESNEFNTFEVSAIKE